MEPVLYQKPSPETHSALEIVRQKLRMWRQNRTHSCRIPEELWQAAVDLVGKGLSLHRIARTLGLDYNNFKRRSLSEKSAVNKLVEIPLSDIFLPNVAPSLAEIVLPNGVILRLFSAESESIIRAFLSR